MVGGWAGGAEVKFTFRGWDRTGLRGGWRNGLKKRFWTRTGQNEMHRNETKSVQAKIKKPVEEEPSSLSSSLRVVRP